MTKNIGSGGPRESDFINRRVTQSIFRAFDYAEAIAQPLNTYVVIHLSDTGEAGAATQFSRIRHKFRDWLVNKGKPVLPIYTYTFEKPGRAIHVNWALYIPEGLGDEFRKKLLHLWFERATGRKLGPYDINIQPIQTIYAKRLAKYFVKGTDPAYVDHFHLRAVHAPQGKFSGKRAGTSMAIGPAVRQEAGFRPPPRRYAAFFRRAAEPKKVPYTTIFSTSSKVTLSLRRS